MCRGVDDTFTNALQIATLQFVIYLLRLFWSSFDVVENTSARKSKLILICRRLMRIFVGINAKYFHR